MSYFVPKKNVHMVSECCSILDQVEHQPLYPPINYSTTQFMNRKKHLKMAHMNESHKSQSYIKMCSQSSHPLSLQATIHNAIS